MPRALYRPESEASGIAAEFASDQSVDSIQGLVGSEEDGGRIDYKVQELHKHKDRTCGKTMPSQCQVCTDQENAELQDSARS